eukprot:CAMPEP_0184725448 /NCGR_PEP_ID=MMETSP0314-20130426/30984_1 /TAXON_ID=38298 /ORGANISM="Rhodella maculata, Strain CCMP 736" /LENGTH=84 /DNA_ID=CAMNT_0027190685 /DNA_START=10 /DNA_END=261 /DNA_ORIENTATION=-
MEYPGGLDAFVTTHLALLATERDSEIAETHLASSDASTLAALAAAGYAITRLALGDTRTGLAARTILELHTRGGRVLAPGKLTP